ncbi:putative Ca2+-dependent phospholipid-binding protein [Handroanthus impetiginosus]|uniref:Putative Ca2+-dependent phospholipid-binding protein n=1 Tax=Handroanthus impetiginosus TaxID=429701 RepID=A0A2G9GI82_9LAMI|nr:putative Ca2+-dependent phospholipid-binding protein [Handroanthus impetiginosus]
MGGNTAVNLKYEAHIPENYTKPKPDSSTEERADFIRRKYELQQFVNSDLQLTCPFPPSSATHCISSSCYSQPAPEKKHYKKQHTCTHIHGLGNALRNSRRKSENKPNRKSNSMAGMVEFVGLLNVNIMRGTNLAVRDMVSSDPYVILFLGNQSVKTRVIKNNLNPVWNERLMLSIPESIPPLKLLVYDKDTFSTDDFMGDAEIDIQPLISAAKALESSSVTEPMQYLEDFIASKESTVVRDGAVTVEDGRVKQEIAIKLQHVERGVLEIELECMLFTQ